MRPCFVRTGSETKYGRVTCRTPFNNYFVLCHAEKLLTQRRCRRLWRGFRTERKWDGRNGSRAEIRFIRVSREVVKRRAARRENRASVQGELDDAAQDEDEQRGGNCQIQRVAHSSPGTSVSSALILITGWKMNSDSEAAMWGS
jgi:hypothetical protein